MNTGRNILGSIFQNYKIYPDRILIQVNQATLTYKEFFSKISRISEALNSLGVHPGETVGIIVPNSIEWYLLFWAVVALGARPVPLDPQMGEWELEQLVGLMNFKAFFITEKYRANPVLKNMKTLIAKGNAPSHIILVDPVEVEEPVIPWKDFYSHIAEMDFTLTEDPEGLLMYACTSGTTGNPKIITVEHSGFYQAQKDMAEYLLLEPGDVMLLGMPLYHQGGFGMGVQAVLSGTPVIYQPQFDPAVFLDIIEKNRVTVIQLTPTLAKVLLTVPNFADYNISSLRLVYFAGEVLPDELARVFYRDLKIRVVNIIGSSETGTMVVWDSSFDQEYTVNDFRCFDFTDVKILDEKGKEVTIGETGRILIHTDALLREYYGNPEESKARIFYQDQKRWFDTGDLAEKLSSRRIRFVGRAKRIIKRGSNLVYPEEIESFLLSHPMINAVAIIKGSSEIFGETIEAYIQPVCDANLTQGQLLKFCRGRISAYKIPDSFMFVDEIPKDIGKIQFKYLSPGNKKE